MSTCVCSELQARLASEYVTCEAAKRAQDLSKGAGQYICVRYLKLEMRACLQT